MDDEAPWQDEQLLRELYLSEEKSQREIARQFSCSHKTVGNWLERHGIDKRDELDNNREEKPYTDESRLRELHHEKELHLGEIAERYDCARSTVWRHCQKFGIEVRENYEKPQPGHEKLTDAEWLRQKHHDERLACHEIADELPVSKDTVLRWLQKHGIERIWRHAKRPELDDAEQLREWYVEQELSSADIGNIIDVSHTCVQHHLRRHGIELRESHFTGELSGPDHPAWKGGYDPYYGPNWQEQREKALRRDNYRCVDCGITNEEHKQKFGRALTCHHVTPIREFKQKYDAPEWWERANELENLVTLCDPHHDKWEGVPVRPKRVE